MNIIRWTRSKLLIFFLMLGVFSAHTLVPVSFAQSQNPQTDSIGLEGTIPTDPPQLGATITFPTNGQTFTNLPVNVTGLCPAGLLVKIFKNQVFAGSVFCESNGTFSLEIDLFSGTNVLVARVFDALDQPGPDSNAVTVTYNDNTAQTGLDQLILTSNFATRGANPGETLRWPLAISGGLGPYAISIDWGDGNTTVQVVEFSGNFNIDHIYQESGTYKIIVKASDSQGNTAFLQLVAISNGAIQERPDDTGDDASLAAEASRIRFVTWPVYIMLLFLLTTFWLGRRYENRRIKRSFERQSQE